MKDKNRKIRVREPGNRTPEPVGDLQKEHY